MDITTRYENDVLIVKLEGNFNRDETEHLENELQNFVKEDKKIILDFSGVSYITSSGVQVLASLFDQWKNQHYTFAVCRLNAQVTQVFHVLHVENLVNIFNTRREAVEGV